MDLIVTVKYTLKNFCDKEDIKGRTPRQLFKDIVYSEENIYLFTDKSEIESITLVSGKSVSKWSGLEEIK